ncbi:unnamed protein product [Hermetia illucens]|uniref:Probable RNA-binding protein EIF1AD n=1 Tax=Hermetia illucens TaxID=343691 RepID=A0A7R8YUW1_HERIL|nr:probable RNA-binding protein EIF1AD [Hermetia illucens]CAD7086617.1 unnamed protein product [Hermetia illucens]
MSRVTKRKHVMREMFIDGFQLPKENQQIVRVVSSRGNNLHEVEPAADGGHFLVSMPTKFRKTIWVKRGDFVLVEPIEEGVKVKGEMCKILTAEHVKEFSKEGIWPRKFTKKRELEQEDDELFRNVNRRYEDSSEEDSSGSDEEGNSTEDDETQT